MAWHTDAEGKGGMEPWEMGRGLEQQDPMSWEGLTDFLVSCGSCPDIHSPPRFCPRLEPPSTLDR